MLITFCVLADRLQVIFGAFTKEKLSRLLGFFLLIGLKFDATAAGLQMFVHKKTIVFGWRCWEIRKISCFWLLCMNCAIKQFREMWSSFEQLVKLHMYSNLFHYFICYSSFISKITYNNQAFYLNKSSKTYLFGQSVLNLKTPFLKQEV